MIRGYSAVNTKLDFTSEINKVEEIKEEEVPCENTFDYEPRKKRHTMIPEANNEEFFVRAKNEEVEMEEIFDEPILRYPISEGVIDNDLSDIEMLDQIEREHSSPFEEMEQQIDREMKEQ